MTTLKATTLDQVKYQITIVEGTYVETYTMDFNRVFNSTKPEGDDYEFIYALEDEFESVMKLGYMDAMTFKANRDLPNQYGIIVRVF